MAIVIYKAVICLPSNSDRFAAKLEDRIGCPLLAYCVEKLFFTLAKVISQNTDLIKRATIDDHLCGDSLMTLEILSDKVFTEFFYTIGTL